MEEWGLYLGLKKDKCVRDFGGVVILMKETLSYLVNVYVCSFLVCIFQVAIWGLLIGLIILLKCKMLPYLY